MSSLALGIAAFLQSAGDVRAQTPPGCINGGMASIIGVSPTVAHVGDTVTISALGVSLGGLSCDITNGQSFLMYPNGNSTVVAGPPTGNGLNGVEMYETNFVLNQGHTITCLPTTSGGAGDVPGCLTVMTTYVVQAADENKALAFTTPRGFTSGSVSGSPKTVKFLAVSDGILTASGGSLTAGGEGNAAVRIVTPGISVTKLCDSNCFPYGGPITFHGTVCNTGDDTLTNVFVIDFPGATITFSNATSLGFPFPPSGGGLLASNECVNFTGSYQPTNNFCGPFTDFVIASGTDGAGLTTGSNFVAKTVFATNSATCSVCVNPCLSITKICSPSVVSNVGGIVNFSGVVTNCGNVPLTNVIVQDTFLGVTLFNHATLGVGGSLSFSTNFTTTTCGTFTNTVTVIANAACSGQALSNAASCSFTVLCPPHIGVTKLVACFLGSNDCGVFSNSAIGVSSDTNNPAFCYEITVTNQGPANLTNVSIIDTNPASGTGFGDLTGDFSCVSPVFLAGTSCTFTFKAEVGKDLTNIVTAAGMSAATGQLVETNANAVVQVFPASVTCLKQYSIDGGPLTNDATLTDQNSHIIVWYVTVSNPSTNVNLADVVVTDVTTNLPGCTVTLRPFSLDAGSNIVFLLCSNSVACSNGFSGITNTISVTADEFSLGTNHLPVCAHDIRGSNIVVSSECSASLFCGQPAACRVTGGGRQDLPNVFPANVRYVTHGGQVGAPVGDRICTVTSQFPIGNPCIHGRWTHVRHMMGGLEGNFHARFYDTLQCACLDTSVTSVVVTLSGIDGAIAQTYTNLVYGPGTTVDAVCNPGNKVAGPEPSPAPANKIAFTGVGDYALTQGNRVPVSVLFRVDIEDRSEPGGSHPKGGTPPPDRNRTRIWILTPTELQELRGSGPDPLLLNFRNAISACNGIDVQDGATVANGTAAFGVRPPDIDDGGELDRGNYQIHPSIMNCDPNNPVGPGLAKP